MKNTIAIAFACVLASGCATLFTDKTQQVQVQSPDAGYEVTINGVPYGETPVVAALDKTKDYVIKITSPTGKVHTCVVESSVGVGWLLLDLLHLLYVDPVPVIVDWATGNWRALDSDTCASPHR